MSAPVGSIVLTRFDRLLSEANLGLGSLEDARLTEQPDRRWRSVQNAQVSLATVRQRARDLSLTASQTEALHRVTTELEQALGDLNLHSAE